MKHLLCLNLIVLLSAFSIFAQDRQLTRENPAVEQRVALIIGNANYETSPLKNPVNDAKAMAQSLSSLGFQVILKQNINQTEMKRAVREFGERIKNGGVGLFYFAGHGVQVKGQNYLVPIGAQITKEEEIEYEGVDVGFVMAQMEAAKNRMNIVILDACRNNPFARSFRSESNGLASINAPSGTLIAYATAPGSVASDGSGLNGLYTQELLSQMKTEGVNIEEVFKRVRIKVMEKTKGQQTPWESSSLTRNFYFKSPGAPTPAPAVASQSSFAVDPIAVELTYWTSIKDSTDAEDYKLYLEKYPNGQFAELALKRSKANVNKTETENSTYSDLMKLAEEAIQRNNVDSAIENLKKATEADSTKPAAFEQLGMLLFERKDYENSKTAMIAALNNGGKLIFPEVYHQTLEAFSSVTAGKLMVTKSNIIFIGSEGGRGYGKSKTFEVELSDIAVETKGNALVVKIRDGVGKIIKGSKDDTKMYFMWMKDSKKKRDMLIEVINSQITKT